MTGSDSSSGAGKSDRRDGRADLWRLPRITHVESRLVRYPTTRARYDGRERIEYDQAVEVRVHIDGDLPTRAITPALVIGGVELNEFTVDADGVHVFYAFEPDRLDADAPVGFRWPSGPDTEPKYSEARYRPPEGQGGATAE